MDILEDPNVKRLLKLQEKLRDELPDEDIEIVDAVAVYVNFAPSIAICISPDDDQPDFVQIDVTEWDWSGGVHSEFIVAGHVRVEYAPVIVQELLADQRRAEDELEAHLDAEPRELVDVSKFTHIQQRDNDGNPIGDPIPLKGTDG